MDSSDAKLQLTPGHWYGWQMLPGYAAEGYGPYFSPILVKDTIPRKTGRRVLTVRFINVLYAEGVQESALDLRVLKHETNYLVSEIFHQDHDLRNRTAIISNVTLDWVRYFCPGLWAARPPSSFGPVEQRSVSRYLEALFSFSD